MTDVLRFWLDLGADGIRADAVRWMSKDPEFRDNLPNPEYVAGTDDPYVSQLNHYNRYGPHLFDYLKELAMVVEEYPDRIILFEDYPDRHLDITHQYSAFYAVNPEVAAPFNFEGLKTAYGARQYQAFVNRFQKLIGGTLRPFYCFSNHDKSRLVSRVGKDQAKLVGLLQLTLPGIPVVYYGDELGMHDVPIPPERVRDPFEKQTQGLGLGRDPARTPMQWNSDVNAGFSVAEPWLPVAEDMATMNVVAEAADNDSSFSMYRRLLELRRSSALRVGSYQEWEGSDDRMFGFIRTSNLEKLLVLLNMSDESVTYEARGEIICSTHRLPQGQAKSAIKLQPHQGVIIRL